MESNMKLTGRDPDAPRVRLSGGGPLVHPNTLKRLRTLSAVHRLSMGRMVDATVNFAVDNKDQFTKWTKENR